MSQITVEFCADLRLLPWLLWGSARTWVPHPESDPWARESPGDERSSSSSEQRAEKCSMTQKVWWQRAMTTATQVFAERMKMAWRHRTQEEIFKFKETCAVLWFNKALVVQTRRDFTEHWNLTADRSFCSNIIQNHILNEAMWLWMK